MVIGNLPEGIRPLSHFPEILYRPGIVPGCVEHRTGEETVGTVHLLISGDIHFIVFPCGLHIPVHERGFSDHPVQARSPVLGNRSRKFRTVFQHIAVVLQHETAFKRVIAGHIGEARILSGLPEPPYGVTELIPAVADAAERILRRRSVVRLGLRDDLAEKSVGSVEVAGLPGGECIFEQILRPRRPPQPLRVHFSENPCAFGIAPL